MGFFDRLNISDFSPAANNTPPPVPVPLNDRDKIPVVRTYNNGNSYNNISVVNFNHILRTGDAHNGADGDKSQYNIDWSSNDAFTRALKTIEDRSAARIQNDPGLQALLNKPGWIKPDREKWEKRLSEIVSEETDKIPGFGDYRSIIKINGYKTVEQNISRLNDLTSDITNNTQQKRFDCGIMSMIEGSTLQKLENRFLSASAGGVASGDWKKPMSYFYATGGATLTAGEKLGGHTFIFTPTGNVIEGTIDPSYGKRSPYIKAATGSSLEQFVKGHSFVGQDGSVYGHYNQGMHIAARADAAAIQKGLKEDGKIFTERELLSRDRIEGFSIAHSQKDGMMMIASRTPFANKDHFEIKIYQKQNIGQPNEGYAMVGYAHDLKKPGEQSPKLSYTYTDPLNGKIFKSDVDFANNAARLDLYAKRSDPNAGADGFTRIAEKYETAPNRSVVAPTQTPTPFPLPSQKPTAIHSPLENFQTEMQRKGYYKGSIDGDHGPLTNTAIEKMILRAQLSPEYQASIKSGKVSLDGQYGPETQKALDAMARRGEISQDTAKNMKDIAKNYDGPHDVLNNAKEIQAQMKYEIAASPVTPSQLAAIPVVNALKM